MDWTSSAPTSSLFPLLSPLHPSLPDPVFYSMQSGLMVCSAVNTAVQLNLAEHLEAPKYLEVLAEEVQADASSLFLLLRALSSIGIFEEVDASTHIFANTDRSRLLLSNSPGSMANIVKLWGAPYQWDSWRDLTYTVRTGKPAMQKHAGHGANLWSYLHQHPQESQVFQQGLTAVSHLVIPAILANYDFSIFRHVVDTGGGHGLLSVSLLLHYPNLPATLFDREMMIEQVRQSASTLPEDITTRYSLISGNFFETVPFGADCYILKNVLMDWSDEDYLRILRRCRAAMDTQEGRLLVIEPVISENSSFTKFFSLQMAMMMHAARHRTLEEHQALFAQAGFELIQSSPLGLEQMLLEGRPQEKIQ